MAENQNKKQSKAMDNIKKGFEYAADLTSLKIKLSKAKSKRKDAARKLLPSFASQNPPPSRMEAS